MVASARGDFAAAAKILDTALAQIEADIPPTQHLPALVLRADIAINMGDHPLAQKFLDEIRQFSLTEADRHALRVELEQADHLALLLIP